jgi:hypothetical protein
MKDVDKYTQDLIKELEAQKLRNQSALSALDMDRANIEGRQAMLDHLLARAKSGYIFHELANPKES